MNFFFNLREQESREDRELEAFWGQHPPQKCYRCDHHLCRGSVSGAVYLEGQWGYSMDSSEMEETIRSMGTTPCGTFYFNFMIPLISFCMFTLYLSLFQVPSRVCVGFVANVIKIIPSPKEKEPKPSLK